MSDEGLSVKQSVVQEALAVNQGLIQQGPLQALQAVGGLELAAMTGAYLEAARRGMPAIVDGYISGAWWPPLEGLQDVLQILSLSWQLQLPVYEACWQLGGGVMTAVQQQHHDTCQT